MDESSRPATHDDVPVVADLVEAAVDELEPTKGGGVWARREGRERPPGRSLGAAVDDPGQLLLVGTIDDTIVGYAAVEVETLRDGGRLARLTDVYVLAEARGVGVGECMMDAVLAWSHDQGCLGVDSLALPGNRATKNFFETHGLVARAIVVHRKLGP